MPSAETRPDDKAQPPLRKCDLVMKGGITSGIVYPRLVSELASEYRFSRIGGTSAGAIAAMMAAAAEAGRDEPPTPDGRTSFQRLGRIPEELGSSLAGLFQPSPDTAAAFDVMMAVIAPRRIALLKWPAALWVALRHRWATATVTAGTLLVLAALSGILIARPVSTLDLVLAMLRTLLLAVPVAVLLAVVVATAALTVQTLKALNENGFGLCDGHTTRTTTATIEPLTDWMEHTLRSVAGCPSEQVRPVCVGDLWGADAEAAYRAVVTLGEGEAQTERAELRKLVSMRTTDCVVMTTDLSHRRPYRFPFDTAVFFWCEACFERYFPDNVITSMHGTSTPVVRDGSALQCPTHGTELRHLPLAPDIPLVLAARLSLSFPGLISAVPLYSVDYTRNEHNRGVVPVWFSDGGITSNFPMRFFDTPWPTRPTFGINLTPVDPDRPGEMVWRASVGNSGVLPPYSPITAFTGFLGAIFDTMHNWNDNTQIVMPGFRDRVVNIRQNENEGGVNLQMPAKVIETLADRGQVAARNLLDGDESTGTAPFDFEVHRWIRYRGAMAGLDDLLSTMRESDAVLDETSFVATYTAPDGVPAYAADDPALDRNATAKVLRLAVELDEDRHPATTGEVPRPLADVRYVPPI